MGNLLKKVHFGRDSRSGLAERKRFLAGQEYKQSPKGSFHCGGCRGASYKLGLIEEEGECWKQVGHRESGWYVVGLQTNMSQIS